MFSLNRLILIDSYKPGTIQEVRLDGHTNLNGVNGAGKTTLLRLIPLFFGERPGRLVPKSRVTDSFAKHYLPNESSYIIFEYRRHEQTCLAVIYASPNEEGLCYRFVDKGFEADDFLETRGDGTIYPISCRDLGRHLAKRRIQCSNQITSCMDYRTVIQNLPHKKGQELRNLIARYSFCQGSTGRRLKDIEKIVSGMRTRGNPSGPEAKQRPHTQAGYMAATAFTDRCDRREKSLQKGGIHICGEERTTSFELEPCLPAAHKPSSRPPHAWRS